MKQHEHENLTKQWILTMLFDSPKTFDQLVLNGCKVMVYGHSTFQEFKSIFDNLVKSNKIEMMGSTCNLTTEAIFEVKKNTILPLLHLTENPRYYEAFVDANREKCNIEFLENLMKQPDDHEATEFIKIRAAQHFVEIAKILEQIQNFLKSNPNFGITGL